MYKCSDLQQRGAGGCYITRGTGRATVCGATNGGADGGIAINLVIDLCGINVRPHKINTSTYNKDVWTQPAEQKHWAGRSG